MGASTRYLLLQSGRYEKRIEQISSLPESCRQAFRWGVNETHYSPKHAPKMLAHALYTKSSQANSPSDIDPTKAYNYNDRSVVEWK